MKEHPEQGIVVKLKENCMVLNNPSFICFQLISVKMCRGTLSCSLDTEITAYKINKSTICLILYVFVILIQSGLTTHDLNY